MGKRKSDEQRARVWLNGKAVLPSRIPTAIRAIVEDAYVAGLRSERRVLKREQSAPIRPVVANTDLSCVAAKEKT